MAKDTVTLSIEEYNRLRDFEKNMKNDYTLVVANGFGYHHEFFVTSNEAIKILAEENVCFQKRIDRIEKEDPIPKLKKMTIWQFLKWRKS